MGLGGEDLSGFLLVSVVLSALVLSAGVVLMFRNGARTIFNSLGDLRSREVRRSAVHASEEFATLVSELRQRVETLEPYTVEYHNAFHKAGWQEVIDTFNQLVAAEQLLDLMMKNRQYRDVLMLSIFLLDGTPEDVRPQVAKQFDDFAHLPGWQERIKSRIVTILDSVNRAASVNRDAGIKRTADRRPTLETLAELRRTLN